MLPVMKRAPKLRILRMSRCLRPGRALSELGIR